MSSITVDFEFEIGDTVYFKAARHNLSDSPKGFTVCERGAVECHGGVQRFYRLTGFDNKDPLSGIPCVALTKDKPAYSTLVGTRDQATLLLYLECRAVDNGGRVHGQHMNAGDFKQAEAWNDDGFIGFGRIASEDVNQYGAHWVTFSDAAWEAAHHERRARAESMLSNRNYRTTAEKRALT